jgi:hypothetical protein
VKVYEAGRDFLLREGRLLERRLFAVRFEGAAAHAVVDAVRAYQNDDGGFGHALEPDKRCPDSTPLDVEMALTALVDAGARSGDDVAEMTRRACDWLASVTTPDGAVPLCFPVIERYPRAEHMTDWTYRPDLNPTAGLVALLRRLGTDHPWVDRAAAYCRAAIADGLPTDAHAFGEVLLFLESEGSGGADGPSIGELRAQLANLRHYRADPADAEYGVSPVQYAPAPDSRWRVLFDDAQIEGHLDRLERDQQDDGGWAITWDPPSLASRLAWRGKETLRALRTLAAYGRLPSAPGFAST